MVTGMLQVLSIDFYALLDPDATLSFVTPLVSRKFDVLPNVLIEPFLVTTSICDSVVARRVFRSCPISFPNRLTWVDLVEHDMVDFDLILGIYWLHSCFSSIDCRTTVVKFNFPNKPAIEWKGGKLILRGRIIYCLQTCKMISKGYLYHIVRVKDLECDIHHIESVSIVKYFSEVFPEYWSYHYSLSRIEGLQA